VSLEECSRKGLAACGIVAAHALVIYALMAWAPSLRSAANEVPLTVQFISEAPSTPPPWQPPTVSVTAPIVHTALPTVEFPVIASSPDRAVTVSVQIAAMATAQQDRSVPKLVSAVEYLREPEPRYPSQSRRLREEGLVVLRVVIDERGNACSIEVETSSGHARLDVAAREAVARAAFRPYVEDGSPRRAQVLIPIEFSLSRGSV
jgi:periplasmic protein TonB